MKNPDSKIKKVIMTAAVLILIIILFFTYVRHEELFSLILGAVLLAVGIGSILLGVFEIRKGAKPAALGLILLISLFPIIFGIIFLHDPVQEIRHGIENRKYTKLLSMNGESIDSWIGMHGGTKYAVYDMENKLFLYGCLPESCRASSADDIAAVFVVEVNTSVVGSYGSMDACRYVVDIDMVDLGTGEILAHNTVYGDPPPERIRVTGLELFKSRYYGKRPTYGKISDACVEMIRTAQ